MPEHTINLQWDSDAAVWIATSSTISGLTLESGSLDVLIERVRYAIPELLELNGNQQKSASVCFRSERHEQVYLKWLNMKRKYGMS